MGVSACAGDWRRALGSARRKATGGRGWAGGGKVWVGLVNRVKSGVAAFAGGLAVWRLTRLHRRTEGERLTINVARSCHRRAGAKKPDALSASGWG